MTMDLDVLVLRGADVKVSKINDFVGKVKGSKFVLLFCSLFDEFLSASFFNSCVEELNCPFVGVRTAGCVTPEGYVSEGVVAGVVHGDFDVSVFSEAVDFEDLEGTVKRCNSKITECELCMVFSSSHIRRSLHLNKLLLDIHDRFPDMQIWGGNSVAPSALVTKDGIFEDHIAFVCLSKAKTDHKMETGFTLDEKREKYVVTKSDMYKIYELDGENASEKYSKIQHMRPWLLNNVANLVTRHDISKLGKSMSLMNKTLYDGFMKSAVKLLGFRLSNEVVTAVGISYMDKDHILPGTFVPEGTKLFFTESSEESQLAVYDRLSEFKDNKFNLVASCLLRQYYINFQFEKVGEKMAKLGSPFIVAYLAGEISVKPRQKTKNIFHQCGIQVLGFKR